MELTIWNFIGVCAFLVQLGSLFLPHPRKIVRQQILSATLWNIHYAGRDLWGVVIFCTLSMIRNGVTAYAKDSVFKIFIILNAFISPILILFFFWQYPWDWILVAITALMTIKLLQREKLVPFLCLSIILALMWVVYHFLCGSYIGVLNDSLYAGCSVCALARHFYKQKQPKFAVA